MLTEEALIFLGGLAALGAVAVGALELLWPTRPRYPVRRVPPVAAAPPPPPPPPPPLSPPSRMARPRRWRSSRPRHAMNGSGSPYQRRDRPGSALADIGRTLDEAPPATLAPVVVAVAPTPPPAAEPQIDLATMVDHCFALYEQRAYAEVAAAAAPAIAAHASAGGAADVARLWSIVALAQQAMEDSAAARDALESAIAVAPAAERAAYERQLATLAAHAAQALVTQAEGAREPASDEGLSALRTARDWCDCGTAVAPDDAPLRELADDVQRRLWAAYERVVLALVQRQHYGDARRLLREALEDPRISAARAETFRELFSGTYGGEIGQLTAQAIRSMQEARETEALAALERAEALLDTVQDEVLPPKRREEVDRRLWWGYKKLGRRRAQAGEHEAAAQALGHALRFAGVGTDRQADTRAALVRALEGLVDTRARLIRELAESGDREAALVQSDRLRSRLRDALQEGLAEEDLAGAFAKAQRVVDEVGVRP
jgi:hypothetical protein